MNKTRFAAFLASGLLIAGLASCGGGDTTPVTYFDATPNTPYGKISDYSAPSGSLKAGDVLRFKVTPSEDFLIDKVLVNNKEATKGEDGYYSWTMEAGANRIEAKYVVDKTVDFVEKFKLNIDARTLYNLRNRPKMFDFRRDGLELMNMSGFFNCVDGDTTHFETMNFGYTVKVRYLGIDTPESTSEIEEWGKSASNYSKDLFNNARFVLLQSQGWARGDEEKAATADGNQRSLAYVWYTNVANPQVKDFRCVNLEMVYQGFSQGIGTREDMGDSFYYMFDKASKSAEANKRHQFSGEVDPNYDYTTDKGGQPRDLELKELYDKRHITYSDDGKNITGDTNPYCDVKTLTRIKGYVSRVIGYAFYMQDKPSYDREGDNLPEAYGIYVFTYNAHPIQVGDYVSVVGVLSIYSGTYQLQGVSWKDFGADPRRDMDIISTGHKMQPIELTAKEFNEVKYDQVLVKVTDPLYFRDKTAGKNSLSFGGSNEVDTYNEKYPFYCSSNKIVFFGGNSAKDNAEIVRLTQDQDVLLSYKTEKSLSYKFYIGGTCYYYPNHAEYIGHNDTAVANTKLGKYVYDDYVRNEKGEYELDDQGNPITVRKEMEIDPSQLITTVYKAKIAVCGGISAMYVSTSGSLSTHCYQITLASPADVKFMGEQ